MRNRAYSLNIVVLFLTLGVFIIFNSCVPLTAERKPLPVSPWKDKFFYQYEPPEKRPAGSVRVTLAIVSPAFGGNKMLDNIYSKVASGLARSMAIDLDKIIISKGMTVTGPFESLDLMTYPDKKNADLSLTPEFFINVQTRQMGHWEDRDGWFIQAWDVRIDGWVVLILREPLSSEKIWIRKIEVGEKSERAEVYAERVLAGSKPGVVVLPVPWAQYQPGNIQYDGRVDAVANVIKKMYPEIMQTAWRYLDINEILILKEKAEEIRKLKRY